MSENNSTDVFVIMKNECSILKGLGKIKLKDRKIFNEVVDLMSVFFEDIRNVIVFSNVKNIFNAEYYEGLFNVENGKLKESKILDIDPFYSLYKHLANLLEVLRKIKEPSASDENITVSEDFFLKSILSSKKNFLNDLNFALCDICAVKLDDSRWIILNKFTKNKLNNIIIQHMDSQQKYFDENLTVNQKKLSEFISERATFETVKGTYEMSCNTENSEGTENEVEDMRIIDANKTVSRFIEPDFTASKIIFRPTINNHHTKESTSVVTNENKPEALAFVQNLNAEKVIYSAITDSRNHGNVPAVSYYPSSKVSSSGNALSATFLIIASILFVLGIIKKRY